MPDSLLRTFLALFNHHSYHTKLILYLYFMDDEIMARRSGGLCVLTWCHDFRSHTLLATTIYYSDFNVNVIKFVEVN